MDVPLTISPEVNEPSISTKSNSITEVVPCKNVVEESTIAVAPDDWPVMVLPTTSCPSTLIAVTRKTVRGLQFPSDGLITNSVG